MADKGDVIRLARLAQKRKSCLFGRPIPLEIVAPQTGADQILPGLPSPLRLGNHVVHRHRPPPGTAILALVSIPLQNVPLGEGELLGGDPYINGKAHDAWDGESL